MYNYMPFILAAIFIVLGLFMFLKPEKAVKKELANSEDSLKKSKRNGIIIFVLGIILAVIKLILK